MIYNSSYYMIKLDKGFQFAELNKSEFDRCLNYDNLRNEYVLEEYHYGTDGAQLSSPVILDFYLIDRQSLEVTDEQINTWH